MDIFHDYHIKNSHQSCKSINKYSLIFSIVIAFLDIGIDHFYKGLPIANSSYRVLLFIAIATFVLLKYDERNNLYKVITLFNFYLCFFLSPLIVYITPEESILINLGLSLLMCLIIYLIFSIKTEVKKIIFWQALFILTFYLFIFKTIYFNEYKYYPELNKLLVSHIFILITHFVFFILFNIITYSFKKSLNIQYEIILEKNKVLEQQKIELQSLEAELRANNEDLDLKVKERTKKLEKQQIVLLQYGFLNSHLLRAPLSRLMGLFNLYIHPDTVEEEKEYILKHSGEAIQQLDKITKDINHLLENQSSSALYKEMVEKSKYLINDKNLDQ